MNKEQYDALECNANLVTDRLQSFRTTLNYSNNVNIGIMDEFDLLYDVVDHLLSTIQEITTTKEANNEN
jgi:hypothetical protein